MKLSTSSNTSTDTSNATFSIKIDHRLAGIRLDQFLSQHLSLVSRSLISTSIRKGLIEVEGKTTKNSYRLKAGDIVCGTVFENKEIDVLPENVDFVILYEDDDLLIISKPPGIVVHPGSGNHTGTLVNGLVYYCQSIADVGEQLRPGIVHRLDKDTSGIMAIAKNDLMHRLLSEQFKERQIEKHYIALLHGTMKDKSGRIVAPIGRHHVNRQKMAVRYENGKYAVSNWEVLDEFDNQYSLVKIRIETGRTHQIRVHMAYLGNPVAGDTIYGSNRDNRTFPRQLLHAYRLAFQHPTEAVQLEQIAPLWDDFSQILIKIGWQGEGEFRGSFK